jgi:DNA (cytosine-5)-methyltransferase 1
MPTADIIGCLNSSGGHAVPGNELSPTLRAMGHGTSHANAGGQVAVAFGGQMSAPQVDIELSQTLQAKNPLAVATAMVVRRLTPRECERLQGVEDDWTLVPSDKKGKPMADGPRYKMLGNSFARPVITWIGQQIERASKESGHAR